MLKLLVVRVVCILASLGLPVLWLIRVPPRDLRKVSLVRSARLLQKDTVRIGNAGEIHAMFRPGK